jgi:tripartite-type tricarboxylate transporter receptor subunit TctC
MQWHKWPVAIGLALVLVAAAARDGGSQNKTIRIVVPYTPGSGPDILSRLMGEAIGNEHGPAVVVENRPGGGTVIGTEVVERAEPDGGMVLLVANSFVINPALKRGNYEVAKDFAPVCYLASTPMVLVVQGASPYKTLADLIAAARAKPGELAFASGGPASSLHIAIEVLRRAADIAITYVPFGGTAPAISALLGGHVTAVWADYPTVVSQYEADIFYGIVAPAKTPAGTLTQLSATFSMALQAPGMTPKLAKEGLFPVGTCGAPFGTYMRRLGDDYARIIREANITTN